MTSYTEATDGSSIEAKETALVWHHQKLVHFDQTFKQQEDLKFIFKRSREEEEIISSPSFSEMGLANNIGEYQLGRTIGEGTFAKVKLAVNSTNGKYVAIKIIDKQMVVKENLMYQVQRVIKTMKLLHHPNIVRIHEPENLLLDCKVNLKVSDFGLSALRKPGDLLTTACGSPSYVAPEDGLQRQACTASYEDICIWVGLCPGVSGCRGDQSDYSFCC